MIESIGLKGYRLGDAQFSPQHANFIVNLGQATSGDVLQLVELARKRIWEELGHLLRTEVRYLPSKGRIRPADESCGR
ncbi:hypothetical protein AVL63_06925 [Nesterenkonia jeotgali]|uniref:UDP-N-acetylenolpyruvoylglucosamine reductase C-terminal domain-containing protein n=2 Tax=Nesterenkonia jeotgali TaxID=317018 RepID=A0A0W8IE25_9MICC|nr:hypothetical protein AVL63_06925 [Nesterenkonia jeotgali]